ncbi:unnamed protein product [Rhizoctonia solani]|uniref:Uncharacterized protein n=1 Tax=Rhizoctonia solani TaxID=456999 RepID=A0A8H3H6I1_9AGAM|nr:unnamed protein product [Rhizoctonia solani]
MGIMSLPVIRATEFVHSNDVIVHAAPLCILNPPAFHTQARYLYGGTKAPIHVRTHRGKSQATAQVQTNVMNNIHVMNQGLIMNPVDI